MGKPVSRDALVKNIIDIAHALDKPAKALSRAAYFSHRKCVCKDTRAMTKLGGWAALKAEAGDLAQEDIFVPPTAVPKAEKYLVTWAQSNTDVHKPTLKVLLRYCQDTGAQLVVIPGDVRSTEQRIATWASELHPYICAGRVPVGEHCKVYGDINLRPTAVTPLSGFEVFAGHASAVFGHPKIQLKTVASGDRQARIFTTTGAVTVPNYTNTKAGAKALPHHVYGGLVLEKDGELFHARHLLVDDKGAAYDLGRKYTARGPSKAPAAEALILGDWHGAKIEEEHVVPVREIVAEVRPKRLILHDVLDCDPRNHHRIRDLFDRIRRTHSRGILNDLDSVRAEVWKTVGQLCDLAKMVPEIYIVRSNHDEALERWLNEADPHKDPYNAPFYFETWAAKAKAAVRAEPFNAFEYWFRQWAGAFTNVNFLGRDEPLIVKGVALHFHGDKGTNGSRGSLLQYSKLGVKSVIGHSHTPGIKDGAMQVGVTAGLDHGYNLTPSSWLNSHAILYNNGKRALINVIDGRWRNVK